MKLNKKLIKKLRNGEIAVHHNGDVELLNKILKKAFPDNIDTSGNYTYYKRNSYDKKEWSPLSSTKLPTFSSVLFLKGETDDEIKPNQVWKSKQGKRVKIHSLDDNEVWLIGSTSPVYDVEEFKECFTLIK
tara:strand:- start:195 stop:587 length:393 start_codon:yes stop_codon:yes gene_type:complete